MRKIVLFLIALAFSTAAFSSVNVQRRIAIFTQQTNLFKQLCFQPDGTYQDGLVIYDPTTSVRSTAMDCNAQALALNQERDAIEREIQSLGGANCNLEIADSGLVDLLNGGDGIVDEMNCPGIGSAGQCAATIGCNLGLSVLKAIPAIGTFVAGAAGDALRRQPALRDCGASGTSCFDNIGASIGHVLYDTVTGICWLVTFGNYCTGEEERPAGQPQTTDPDGATRTRALAASQQTDQQVVSFTSDPVGWVMQGVNAIINMAADAISRRYGCRQWSGQPFISECVLPMEWDCANCDQKLNMVCGTLGYISAEIIATVFTGGAVGGADVLIGSLRGVRAVAAVEEYVVATRAARLVGRVGAAAGRGLGYVWNGIANSRTVSALSTVASRVNTAARTVRIYAAGQDGLIAAARRYNQLSEAAFELGYNATAGARNRMLERLLTDMPKLSDIRSGAYARQGIRTPEDYLRIATSRMTPADRARMRVITTTDNPPRVVIVDSRAVAVESDIRFDFNPQRPQPAPQVVTIPPPAPVRAVEEATEVEEIVVTGTRRRTPTPEPERPSGIVVSERPTPARVGSITEGGLPQRVPSAEIRPATPNPRNGVVTDVTSGRSIVVSSDGEDLLRRIGGEHVTFRDREIILDVVMGGPRKAAYFDEAGRFDDAFRTRYREIEARLTGDADELARYRRQVEALSAERVAAGNQKTLEELEDIRNNNLRVRDEEFNCANLSRLTPGAFPSGGGNCRRLKFDEDVNGRYCSCGGMSKTSFTWLVRCPTRSTDYHQLATYVDELALPFDSAPEMCTRVDIPRGKECYIGPTSPTFAGFGGTTQILCENRAPRPPRGKDGAPPTAAQVAAYEAQLEDMRRFGIQFGEPAVRPVRWSPFSTFPEYQNIVERAARACTDVCDINEIANVQREFERATAAIRARGNPAELERLAVEQRNFDQYLRELREGRKTYPTSRDFSPNTPAPVAGVTDPRLQVPGRREPVVVGSDLRTSETVNTPALVVRSRDRAPDITLAVAGILDDEARVVAAERIIGNVTENPSRRDALIRAHNVAPERGFGSYTAADLREKTNILRYNKTTEEVEAYRRANGGRYPPAVYTKREADEILRRGLAGNSDADDAFIAARSDAVRARQLRGNFRQGQDLENVRTVTKSAADGYAAEAVRTNSPQLTAEAWRLYARAGDSASANRMLRLGLQQGMDPQRVFSGLQEEFRVISEQIARRPDNVDALIIERNALREILENGRETLGLPPRVIPQRLAPGEQVRPPRTEDRRISRGPDPQIQPPVSTPAPAPQVMAPSTPATRPVPRTPSIVVADVPPGRAANMANEFRLGTGGRVQDPDQAAELYYRAADGAVPRETRSLRSRGETNFLEDRNFFNAFTESMSGDGTLAKRMVDDIYAAGGSEAVNAFLRENFERFNTRQPNPRVRGNLRELIGHVRDRYGRGLFDPQKSHLTSWERSNFDEPISISAGTRSKIQEHIGLTDEQNSYLDNLIQNHTGRPMSDADISRLMDNPSSGAVDAQANRPFRKDRVTSILPEGVTPDDIIAQYNRGNYRAVERPRGSSESLSPFDIEMDGNRYRIYVCTEPRCEVGAGQYINRNEVRTVYPECGPNVRALPKLSKAKEVLRQGGTLTRDSFYQPMPCR